MGASGFGPKIMFKIATPFMSGGEQVIIPVTETVVSTWIIMAVLILFAVLATRNLKKVPKGMQVVTEALVGGINGLTKQTMGEKNAGFAPYVGTLILFVALSNIAGLFNVRPPTADINTTMGLALITFSMIHIFGVRSKGIGSYLKGFFEPMPFLFPINIMGEIATPISLSFRLFGNIIGGVIIMNLLYGALSALSGAAFGLVGISNIVPVFQVLATPLHVYFDLFAGLLQSFIFAMLTMVNVSMAMD